MTLFEKIIAREIPATIEYEDDEIIVIHDIAPKKRVHLLLIPKKPIVTAMDITNEDMGVMGNLFFVAKHVAENLKLEGYTLQCNVGEKGGQEVMHVHVHLMAD